MHNNMVSKVPKPLIEPFYRCRVSISVPTCFSSRVLTTEVWLDALIFCTDTWIQMPLLFGLLPKIEAVNCSVELLSVDIGPTLLCSYAGNSFLFASSSPCYLHHTHIHHACQVANMKWNFPPECNLVFAVSSIFTQTRDNFRLQWKLIYFLTN